LTHINAAILFLDALDVQIPYRVVAMGHGYSLVVR